MKKSTTTRQLIARFWLEAPMGGAYYLDARNVSGEVVLSLVSQSGTPNATSNMQAKGRPPAFWAGNPNTTLDLLRAYIRSGLYRLTGEELHPDVETWKRS